MSDRVNLLLLLSALLSALAGAGQRAPAPRPSVAVAQVVQASVAAHAIRTTVQDRPATALPGLVAVAQSILRPAWRLGPAVPLFASRRRE